MAVEKGNVRSTRVYIDTLGVLLGCDRILRRQRLQSRYQDGSFSVPHDLYICRMEKGIVL